MDQSMKRGMEQSNAMGWMVEKPWMTLLVGFIYIYILDIQRYPLKKKTETKKAASLQHAFLFRALSTPKPWFWKSNSAGPRPRSCSRCCVMDSQAAVLWARHIKSLCNVVYVYISIHGYRYWYEYEYIYIIYISKLQYRYWTINICKHTSITTHINHLQWRWAQP